MDNNKRNKLYEMLNHMSKYSFEQPQEIEKLCKDSFVSPAYTPAINMLVEAFLTVRSFSLLMFDGLVSTASAILRILIEQVSILTVISSNSKAMYEFLKFYDLKSRYYRSSGEEHEKIRQYIIEMSNCKFKSEGVIKDYLDYGWIRVVNNNKGERGDKIIIKEARLEEVIVDINEQLNAFAHGQRSIFEFFKKKDLADRYVSRIVMIAGKLFLLLCKCKQTMLSNDTIQSDKFFNSYLNTKLLYLDLNARATNERIGDFVKNSNNLDRDIIYSMSTLDHARGLLYQSELNTKQVNNLARIYVIELINTSFMLLYKYLNNGVDFSNIDSFDELLSVVGINVLNNFYKNDIHSIALDNLVALIKANNDEWAFINTNGEIIDSEENFITDFTSLVYSMFEKMFPEKSIEDFLKSFVPVT